MWRAMGFPPRSKTEILSSQVARAAGRQLRTKAQFGTDYRYIQTDPEYSFRTRTPTHAQCGAADQLYHVKQVGVQAISELWSRDTFCALLGGQAGAAKIADMPLPTVHPGNSVGHHIVTRIASSAIGIGIVRRLGPRIDPVLIRLTGGRLSCIAPFLTMLVMHVGARTGIVRTTAVAYFTEGERVIAIASNFGSPKNPGWYHNIKANPAVTLLGRGFSGPFLAEEVVGPERERLFQLASGSKSPFDSYQRSAGARRIPVIAFHPV
jgi:deazaflavin-dependent oxidoreductase (nitroreductase family)